MRTGNREDRNMHAYEGEREREEKGVSEREPAAIRDTALQGWVHGQTGSQPSQSQSGTPHYSPLIPRAGTTYALKTRS